jgi:hypothetical protein
MEPTTDTLQAIRHKLEMGWCKETAYELYNGAPRSPVGQCFVSSLFVYTELRCFNPVIVRGSVEEIDEDHFWLEIDGKILDFTADQFGVREFPQIVFDSYENYPRYKPDQRVTDITCYHGESGFERYTMLTHLIHEKLQLDRNIIELPL